MREYDLYIKYAGVCLDEEYYNLLEERGFIGKGLKNLFNFKLKGGRLGFSNKEVIKKISSYNQLLYLENWGVTKYKYSECAFVYKHFMVVCKMPDYNSSNFFDGNIVKPIVIPLKNIKRIEPYDVDVDRYLPFRLFDKYHDFGIRITFFNGVEFDAILYSKVERRNHNSKIISTTEENVNFSYDVIQNFLQKNTERYYSRENTQKVLTKMLCSFINNCTDFGRREFAIRVLELENLNKYLYVSERIFVQRLIEFLPQLKEKCNNQNLITDLEEVRKIETENSEKISETEKEIKKLQKDLEANKGKKGFGYKLKKSLKAKKIKNKFDFLNCELGKLKAPFELIRKINKEFENIANNIDVDIERAMIMCDIYSECQKRNLTEVDSDGQILQYDLLCKQINIDYKDFKFNDCKAVFEANINMEKYIKNLEEIQSNRFMVMQRHNINNEKSRIVGKEKYLLKINEKLNKLSEEKEHVKKHIGYGYELKELQNLEKEICDLEKLRSKVSGKLYDIEHTEFYYKYLEISINNYEVNEFGFMDLNAKIDSNKPIKLNDTPIILDGAIIINIIKDGVKKGSAYLLGKDIDLKSEELSCGLRIPWNYKLKAVPFEKTFEKDVEYTFEVEPIAIWMIEK